MNIGLFAPAAEIIKTVGNVATDLFTTDKERIALGNEAYRDETARLGGQIEINKIEASNKETWRPFIGRVCGWGLAYNFIFQPLLVWAWHTAQAFGLISIGVMPPPPLDSEPLWALTSGMLGLSAWRTIDKVKGAG